MGYAAIGLVQPKWNANVGGVMRAVMCYGAALVVIEGDRFKPENTDTTKAWRHIPVTRAADVMEGCPYDCVPVAVELVEGARSLVNFVHPRSAFYILGPEDGSVPKRVLDRCKHVIQIPTRFCMNLAATANVVLYDRMAKEARHA